MHIDPARDALRVCAVMVTYHPDAGLAERLRRVLGQVDAMVIVDNGSTDMELRSVRDMLHPPAVSLIPNGRNLGIATALNRGAQQAITAGFSWVLLLDQDSVVDLDIVRRLQNILARCPDPQRVAVVGSRFRDPKGQSPGSLHLSSHGDGWQEVESTITSGSLLSIATYTAIGPFRDEFFIDYVDTEFCFRARSRGYRIIESTVALMSHSVGAPSAHTAFGSTTWTSNHSPDRRYYIARNNTVLLREYGSAGRAPWQWKSVVRCLRLCKRIAYYETDKRKKIRAVAQGWWHGIKGRMGPRPPDDAHAP